MPKLFDTHLWGGPNFLWNSGEVGDIAGLPVFMAFNRAIYLLSSRGRWGGADVNRLMNRQGGDVNELRLRKLMRALPHGGG